MKRVQRGFSLIELMVAMVIGLVLMTGVVQMFLSSKQVFSTQQGISRVQETGRLAVDFIAEDVRESGFFGCARPTKWNFFNTLNNAGKFGRDFSLTNWLQIFTAAPTGMDLGDAPKAGTPILALYGANSESVSVVGMNTSNEVFVAQTPSEGSGCPSGFCEKDIVAATDCEKIWIFEVTTSEEETITVEGESVNAVSLEHGSAGNSISQWGGVTTSLAGRIDRVVSEVYKIESSVYFIRDNTAGRPTLWHKRGDSTPYELLEGVENVNIELGLDNAGADLVVDEYVNPSDMTSSAQWGQVAAMRLELLVQSPEDNVASEPQSYTFAGETKTADDKRIRQVFTATVGIRPKLN